MTGTYSIPSSALRGWAVSFLLHGLTISMGLTLFADLKLVPEKEPFRWQVSRVMTPPLEPTPEAQPSEPVAQQAPVPPTTAREVARVAPQKPAPQVTEVRQAETKPVVQVVQAQTMETVERPIAQPVTREMKAVQPEQPAEVAAQAVSAVETQARTAEVMTKTGPVTAERATVTRESVAASAPVAPSSVEAVVPAQVQQAQGQPSQAPIQEAMVRAEPAPRHAVLEPRPTEPPAPPRDRPAVEAVPVRAAPGTKADYGWLADTLRRRVAEVKRYPHEARHNHWHGKVVLHAVIKDDGHLADLRVHESSGHDVLDEAAMEAVRHACPLDLQHPLGRHQVAIRIPINYTLND